MIGDYRYSTDISQFKTPPLPEFHIGDEILGVEYDHYHRPHPCTGHIIGMRYASSEFQLCAKGQWWVYSYLVTGTNNPDTGRHIPYVKTIWINQDTNNAIST